MAVLALAVGVVFLKEAAGLEAGLIDFFSVPPGFDAALIGFLAGVVEFMIVTGFFAGAAVVGFLDASAIFF